MYSGRITQNKSVILRLQDANFTLDIKQQTNTKLTFLLHYIYACIDIAKKIEFINILLNMNHYYSKIFQNILWSAVHCLSSLQVKLYSV